MTPLYVQDVPPGNEVCDFCDSSDVRWVFPCRDHTGAAERAEALLLWPDSSPAVTSTDITATSTGDWAACPACHALILRGDRDRLARRSAKRIHRKYAAKGILIPLANLTAHVRRRQDDFWANRMGPPFPASESWRIRRGRTP